MKTKIIIGCSLFCLVTAGALNVGIINELKADSEPFMSLLVSLILFIASWMIMSAICLFRKKD